MSDIISDTRKTYEVTFVQGGDDVSIFRGILKKYGAEVTKEKPLEKIHLVYPIKKQSYGFMGGTVFSIDPARLADLQKELKLQGSFLRVLLHVYEANHTKDKRQERGASSYRASQKLVRVKKPLETSEVLTNEALERKIEEISQ